MNELRNPESEKDENPPISRREFLEKSRKFFLALAAGTLIVPATRKAIAAEAAIKGSGSYDFSENYAVKEKIVFTEMPGDVEFFEWKQPLSREKIVIYDKVYFSPDGQFAAVPTGERDGKDWITIFPAEYIPKNAIRPDGTIPRTTIERINGDPDKCQRGDGFSRKMGPKRKGRFGEIGWGVVSATSKGEKNEYMILTTAGPDHDGDQANTWHLVGWQPERDGESGIAATYLVERAEFQKKKSFFSSETELAHEYYEADLSKEDDNNRRKFITKLLEYIKSDFEKSAGLAQNTQPDEIMNDAVASSQDGN